MYIIRRFIQILVLFGILASILLVSSGRIGWLWAWVYIGIYIGSTVFNSIVLLKRRPEVIAERSKTQMKHDRDKVIGGFWVLLENAFFVTVSRIHQALISTYVILAILGLSSRVSLRRCF